MAEPWNDKKKWWMDLVKIGISTILSTLVTILIVTFIVNRKQYKWQTNYSIRAELLRTYDKACAQYWVTGYDAIKAAYFGKTRDSSDDIKKWQDQSADDLTNATENIREWFDINNCKDSHPEQLLSAMLTKKKQLKSIFDSISARDQIPRTDTLQEQWNAFRDSKLIQFGKDYSLQKKLVIVKFRTLLDD